MSLFVIGLFLLLLFDELDSFLVTWWGEFWPSLKDITPGNA